MRARLGAVLGLASAGVALGSAHLVAGVVGTGSSPVVAVGSSAIDLAPAWLKSFAIRTFGAQDKAALLIGIGVVVVALAIGLGIASVRRPGIGMTGLAILGVVGAAAALTRPGATAVDALPAVVGVAAGALTLSRLHRRLVAVDRDAPRDPSARPTDGVDRRRFLVASGVALGAAALAGVLGGVLSRRKQADASRAAVSLPAAADASAPVAADAELGIDGLSPFYTPNDEFYRVDTALLVPSVPAEEWRLRVHGMVERELDLDYESLTSRPLVERDVTLACVSNEVGGQYVGNARWIGAPLADLLDEAGVDPAATQLVSTSSDGFTAGTPVAAVTDGRDAMLAVAMNGEPLPIEHGFPVRLVVPGLYGYVSATKWLVDLELTTFDAYDPYWIRRGWAEQAPIKTQSRIDTPHDGQLVAAGDVVVAGVAWAQHRGIDRVEVRADDGSWGLAELAAVESVDTWRQWRITLSLPAGDHAISVRATDGEGDVQTAELAEPFPDGATGHHTIGVRAG